MSAASDDKPKIGAYLLENRDGESGGLASSRLGLRNNVMSLHHGDDGTLLDRRWTLETAELEYGGCGSNVGEKTHP